MEMFAIYEGQYKPTGLFAKVRSVAKLQYGQEFIWLVDGYNSGGYTLRTIGDLKNMFKVPKYHIQGLKTLEIMKAPSNRTASRIFHLSFKTPKDWEDWILNKLREIEDFCCEHWKTDPFIHNPVLNWHPKAYTSFAGVTKSGYISVYLALNTIFETIGYISFMNEYESYINDPEIGGFFSNNQECKILHHLTHEIAHCIHFYRTFKENIPVDDHGPIFQEHYRVIRNKFLNPYISSQIEMKRKYIEEIRQFKKEILTA